MPSCDWFYLIHICLCMSFSKEAFSNYQMRSRVQMWVRHSNVSVTFKCECDIQLWVWRSIISLTFKCEFDIQMWVWRSIVSLMFKYSNVSLTFKCEFNVQVWVWPSNVSLMFMSLMFKFEFDSHSIHSRKHVQAIGTCENNYLTTCNIVLITIL